MNWEQLKKNVGYRVQLVPIATSLEANGEKISEIDDDWIIEKVSNEGVDISNPRTGHVTRLGKDHIYNFTTNPDKSRGSTKHGFLTLTVQIYLQGQNLTIRPCARPGQKVAVSSTNIVEKWVDLRYPTDSGLQQRLESSGYQVRWSLDSKLSRRIDLEGWELVVEPDVYGIPTTFRVKDRVENHNLIKKRTA